MMSVRVRDEGLTLRRRSCLGNEPVYGFRLEADTLLVRAFRYRVLLRAAKDINRWLCDSR
jgi:hypothetical protein